MRIEKFETGYKITDLYISAAVLCHSGMELKELVPCHADRKQNMFVIEGDTERIKEIIDSFFNGKCSVDANLFKSKLLSLKIKLSERRENAVHPN